ncbi:MAG: endolytic transglycosylase MltG [Pseudomonadota bacterium]
MWRHIASNFLTLLVVLIFLLGGVILWGQRQYNSAGPLPDTICLQVPGGSTFSEISELLASEGAVSNASILRIGADYADKTRLLKAGSWLIPENASMAEITDLITRGGASTCGTEVIYRIGVNSGEVEVRELDPATNRFVQRAEFDPFAEEPVPEVYAEVRARADTRYRVSMAEGVTSWQVVNVLGEIDALDGEVETIPPEGSLAPDSYEFSAGDARVDVLERMQGAQAALLAAAWAARDPDVPLETPEEALILASIIEKETGVGSERPQVASVFVNRLERGMRLQTDPTVIYGITNGVGVLGRGVRQSELRRATPYNTYVIDGLPPTPIANPGEASLMAAVQPPETDLLFFVARTLDPRDGHNFAATLDEHNRNVAAYRALEREVTDQ